MASDIPVTNLYPGNDSLPDIAGTKFDHANKKGSVVKFLWGVSTSSYQVEGGNMANDWSVFSQSSTIKERVDGLARVGKISLNLENPGSAVGQWDLDTFCRDLEHAKSLGINAYRLSLEWSRIQKRPQDTSRPYDSPQYFEMDAISHYEKMIKLLVENNITPVVTLNHITLPDWVLTPTTNILGIEDDGFKNSLGGWENPKTVAAFSGYAKFVANQFKDYVRYWITINEPTSLIGFGYLAGLWPPGFIAAEDRARKALFNLVEAHVQAYDAIREITGDESMIGLAHAMVFPKARPDNEGANEKAALQYDYCFNRYFLDAVVDGIYNPALMRDGKDCQVIERWKGRLDFVGLNYYRSAYIYKHEIISLAVPWAGGVFDEDLGAADEPHNLLNDLGWEAYPGGLYRILRYLNERFRLPILITENGFAEKSDPASRHDGSFSKRAPYIVAHLCQVLHAISEGIDVLGYLHWSLVDNWEWDYDYMPKARFGLYTVDRNPPGQKVGYLPREPTNGAMALGYVIQEGKIAYAVSRFGTITPSGDALIPPSSG